MYENNIIILEDLVLKKYISNQILYIKPKLSYFRD